MLPTSFQFVMSMPGDTRLVAAVRDLTAHAATYANCAADVSQRFAQQVAEATESAIGATGIQDAPIEFQFHGDARVVRVTITWSQNGSRASRQVEQTLPA
jgi:hypothetical protein